MKIILIVIMVFLAFVGGAKFEEFLNNRNEKKIVTHEIMIEIPQNSNDLKRQILLNKAQAGMLEEMKKWKEYQEKK